LTKDCIIDNMASNQFKNGSHHISFKLAISGIWYTFTSQPNMRIIAIFAFLALLSSFLLKIAYFEYLIVVWTIFIVCVAEMINTSIESVTDLITKEWSTQAKIAKDVSSGMVLLTVIGAFIVGLMVFLPKVILLLM